MEENKWKSRKFWMAVVAGIVGLVTAIWGTAVGEMVSTIAGAVLVVLVSIGYITAEAKVDAARIYMATNNKKK
jgi:uncharacterized membrane protein